MDREIYINKNVPIPPIQWVYGTDGLQIGFNILDFDLATVSSVKFYSLTASGARYEATGTKNGSTVSFKPVSGFFAVGCNTLQCELVATSGTVYSFAVSVYCEENNKFEGAEQDPVALANYIEQINKNTRDLTDLKERFDQLPEGGDSPTKEELSDIVNEYFRENPVSGVLPTEFASTLHTILHAIPFYKTDVSAEIARIGSYASGSDTPIEPPEEPTDEVPTSASLSISGITTNGNITSATLSASGIVVE